MNTNALKAHAASIFEFKAHVVLLYKQVASKAMGGGEGMGVQFGWVETMDRKFHREHAVTGDQNMPNKGEISLKKCIYLQGIRWNYSSQGPVHCKAIRLCQKTKLYSYIHAPSGIETLEHSFSTDYWIVVIL